MKESERSVKKEQLTSGEMVYIQGKVDFARIVRHMDANDIKRENEFIKSRPGKGERYTLPEDVKATKIAISNAGVRPKSGTTEMTNCETYINESLYQNQNSPEKEFCYSIISRGNKLPGLAVPDENGQFVPLTNIEGEPDNGLPVILCVQCFYTEKHYKWSWGLVAVYFPEGFRPYVPQGMMGNPDELSRVGIVTAQPILQRDAPEEQPAQAQPTTAQPQAQQPQGTQFATPQQQQYASQPVQQQQQYAPAPATAAPQQQYASAPAPAPQVQQQQQYAQPQTVAPAPAAAAPVAPQPVAGSAFGGQQQQQVAPPQSANPWENAQQVQTAPQPGITYANQQ